MSQWGKYRKCGSCRYMDEADTDTGFGCYQDKAGVYAVYESRVACSSYSRDFPSGYAPIRDSDSWDYRPNC